MNRDPGTLVFHADSKKVDDPIHGKMG